MHLPRGKLEMESVFDASVFKGLPFRFLLSEDGKKLWLKDSDSAVYDMVIGDKKNS